MPLLLLLFLFWQESTPLKPFKEFELKTNYELKKKPPVDQTKIVFEQPEEKRSNSTDLLPFLSIELKVKKWASDVMQIKVIDALGKTILKRKPNDDGTYQFDLGFVDDFKDKIAQGKFYVIFLKDKKIVEQIAIVVEEDGTFLVNGERRGKF
jgi:hypothetical protein